jgi:hypothetical protein
MNYGSGSRSNSSSLNQEEDKEVADGLSDNSLKFHTDGFPQLGDQGDGICQFK